MTEEEFQQHWDRDKLAYDTWGGICCFNNLHRAKKSW